MLEFDLICAGTKRLPGRERGWARSRKQRSVESALLTALRVDGSCRSHFSARSDVKGRHALIPNMHLLSKLSLSIRPKPDTADVSVRADIRTLISRVRMIEIMVLLISTRSLMFRQQVFEASLQPARCFCLGERPGSGPRFLHSKSLLLHCRAIERLN
jgi:hypothetical protein